MIAPVSDNSFNSSDDGLHRRNNNALGNIYAWRPREKRLTLPIMLIQIAKVSATWLGLTNTFAAASTLEHN